MCGVQRETLLLEYSDLASFAAGLEAKHNQMLEGIDTSSEYGRSLQVNACRLFPCNNVIHVRIYY